MVAGHLGVLGQIALKLVMEVSKLETEIVHCRIPIWEEKIALVYHSRILHAAQTTALLMKWVWKLIYYHLPIVHRLIFDYTVNSPQSLYNNP